MNVTDPIGVSHAIWQSHPVAFKLLYSLIYGSCLELFSPNMRVVVPSCSLQAPKLCALDSLRSVRPLCLMGFKVYKPINVLILLLPGLSTRGGADIFSTYSCHLRILAKHEANTAKMNRLISLQISDSVY